MGLTQSSDASTTDASGGDDGTPLQSPRLPLYSAKLDDNDEDADYEAYVDEAAYDEATAFPYDDEYTTTGVGGSSGDTAARSPSEASRAQFVYDANADAGPTDFDATQQYFNENAFEYCMIEEDVYLVRRMNSSEFFVIAREDDPSVRFCRQLGVQEAYEMRELLRLEPPSYEDVQKHGIPGAAARFVAAVLYEDPEFILYDAAGEPHFMGEEREVTRHDNERRPEGIELPSTQVSMLALDPIDPAYERKVRAARGVMLDGNTPDTLRSIDNELHSLHMHRFGRSGDTGEFATPPTDGFSTVSPVEEEEEWFVLHKSYYLLFRSYERLCQRNGNMLYEIKTRLASTPSHSYVLGLPTNDDGLEYQSKTERQVLLRLVGADLDNAKLENDIFNEYTRARQTISQVASLISTIEIEKMRAFDNEVRVANKSLLPLVTSVYNDTLVALKGITDCVGDLDAIMERLTALRKKRVSNLED